ncbi:Plug domain-containing protein, partial [Acinetobacter baumannii]
STQDLGRILPGVQMAGSGSLHYPLISVRGVTSAQDFYNPALTLYVDGVPQMPILVNQSLVEVERVELLTGPQGTLYGKS